MHALFIAGHTHTGHEFPLYFFAFPILATLAKHFPHCHRNQYAFVASPWQVSKVPQMQLCHRFSTHRRGQWAMQHRVSPAFPFGSRPVSAFLPALPCHVQNVNCA